ncbi:MAG: hypothetical protein LBT46_15015, partial [Planctomycetaceae bacterium]|nr:hypothetical protein [Planctomycetaceae bacterium]
MNKKRAVLEVRDQKLAIIKQSETLLSATAEHSAEEIDLSFQKLRDNERDVRRKLMKPELTKKQINNIVSYQPFDGQSIGQWFESYVRSDIDRIFQSVQRGVIEGTTLAGIMQTIRGTETQAGILQASRNSARMLGRTIINGVANQGRLEMYRQNADVLDGVKW